MELDIQIRDPKRAASLRRHVDRRIRSALKRFSGRIARVVVRISDLNGPRGGLDQHCHLMLAFPGQPDIVISDRDSDPYVTIDRAAERARRTLRRQIERARRLTSRDALRTAMLVPGD